MLTSLHLYQSLPNLWCVHTSFVFMKPLTSDMEPLKSTMKPLTFDMEPLKSTMDSPTQTMELITSTSGTFYLLPVELELMILELLSSQDLASLERTSSYFRDVIFGGGLWRKRAEVKGREEVDRLERSIKEKREFIAEMLLVDQRLEVVLTNLQKVINIMDAKTRDLEEALAQENWKEVLKLVSSLKKDFRLAAHDFVTSSKRFYRYSLFRLMEA